MYYKSPFHIVSNVLVDEHSLTPEYLKLLKKQKLLELQMYGDELKLGNDTYTKDDIIKTFDQLENQHELKFHVIIWKNKELLEFLSKGSIHHYHELEISIRYNPSLRDPEFLKFISPYAGAIVKKESTEFFKNEEFDHLTKYISLLNLLTADSREEALANIKFQLDYYIEKLDAVEHKRIAFVEAEYKTLKNSSFYVFLNELPVEMAKTVNQLAREIINSCITVEKTHIKYVFTVYQGFRNLNCEENLKKIIEGNYEIYRKRINNNNVVSTKPNVQSKVVQKKKSSRITWGIVIFIALFVIFATRMINVLNRKSTNDYPINQNTFLNNTNYSKSLTFQEVLQLLTNKEYSSKENDVTFYDFFDKKNIPNYGEPIEIVNNTPYEVCILVDGILGPYSSNIIKPNSISEAPHANNDFVVYVGNNWDSTALFSLNNKSFKGGFITFDDNTKKHLNKIYPSSYSLKRIEINKNGDLVVVKRITNYGDDLADFDLSDYLKKLHSYYMGKEIDSQRFKNPQNVTFEQFFTVVKNAQEVDKTDPSKIFNFTTSDLYVLNNGGYAEGRSELIKSYTAGKMDKITPTHTLYMGKDWIDSKGIPYKAVGQEYVIKGLFNKMSKDEIYFLDNPFKKIYSIEDLIVLENNLGALEVIHTDKLDNIFKTKMVQKYIEVMSNNIASEKYNNLKTIKNYTNNFDNVFKPKPQVISGGIKLKVINNTDYDIRLIGNGFLEPYSTKVIESGKKINTELFNEFNLIIGKDWDDNIPLYDGKKLYFGGFKKFHPEIKNIAKTAFDISYGISTITVNEKQNKIGVIVKYDSGKEITYTL